MWNFLWNFDEIYYGKFFFVLLIQSNFEFDLLLRVNEFLSDYWHYYNLLSNWNRCKNLYSYQKKFMLWLNWLSLIDTKRFEKLYLISFYKRLDVMCKYFFFFQIARLLWKFYELEKVSIIQFAFNVSYIKALFVMKLDYKQSLL